MIPSRSHSWLALATVILGCSRGSIGLDRDDTGDAGIAAVPTVDSGPAGADGSGGTGPMASDGSSNDRKGVMGDYITAQVNG
jgi:hypothetical protein